MISSQSGSSARDPGGPENALTPRLSGGYDLDPHLDLLAFGQAQVFGECSIVLPWTTPRASLMVMMYLRCHFSSVFRRFRRGVTSVVAPRRTQMR